MFAWLWECHVLGAARKDRVHKAAQGVLVCAAVSWPASERFERKREKISRETEEGRDVGATVSWSVGCRNIPGGLEEGKGDVVCQKNANKHKKVANKRSALEMGLLEMGVLS